MTGNRSIKGKRSIKGITHQLVDLRGERLDAQSIVAVVNQPS